MCYCCEDVITLDARVVDKVVFTRKRKPEESSLEMLSIAKCPSGFFDGEFPRTVGGVGSVGLKCSAWKRHSLPQVIFVGFCMCKF